MKAFIAIAVLCLASAAFAEETPFHLLESNPLNFSAPVVNTKANLTEAPLGAIVYDSSAGAFFGLAPNSTPGSVGSWIQLGASTTSGAPNVTSTSTGNEHVERIMFGGNGGSKTAPTPCITGSCTVYAESGTWVNPTTGVSRSTQGQYQVNFPTEFSDVPTCVCTIGDNAGSCLTYNTTSSSVKVETATLQGTLADSDAKIICMGPH